MQMNTNEKQHTMHPPIFEPMLTPRDVAKILNVTTATVRNMIKRGDLDAFQIKSGRGSYRIPLKSLNNLMGTNVRTPANTCETRTNPNSMT